MPSRLVGEGSTKRVRLSKGHKRGAFTEGGVKKIFPTEEEGNVRDERFRRAWTWGNRGEEEVGVGITKLRKNGKAL